LTTQELARVIRLIGERKDVLSGLLHVAARAVSKYDLLCQLAERLPWLTVDIEPVDQPVIDRSLTSTAFKELTGYVAPSWAVMLDELAQVIERRRSSRE
jgi:dTDP-4-dehydrorhamnose reductase